MKNSLLSFAPPLLGYRAWRGGGWLAALLLGLLLPLAGQAQFSAQTAFSTGAASQPVGIATADVNGDGKPDLLTANQAPGTAGVLLNTTAGGGGSPTFAPVAAFSTGSGSSPISIGAADVNGDGKPDLLFVDDAHENVGVLRNTTATGAGTATFATAVAFSYGPSRGTRRIAAADVNGDGKPDLLLANTFGSSAGVLLNTTATGASTLSFAAAAEFSTGSGSQPYGIAAADVNGDGKPDLLTANYGGSSAGVLLNTTATGAGTASFAAVATFSTGFGGSSLSYAIAAADVNGDGKPDLLTANYGDDNAGVLLNTTATGAGTASFAAVATFSCGPSPTGIAAADVNGDGKVDLLTVNQGGESVGVLLNATATGAGTAAFAAVTAFATGSGSGPVSLAVADVNADGKPDLLTANSGTDAAGVFFNQYPPFPTLTSLAPASGPVGTSVALTGTNFAATSTVRFNGTAASSVTFNSATSLTAVVPTGASTGNVTVANQGSVSNGLPFTVQALTIVSRSPARNLRNAPASANVAVTFDQPLQNTAATRQALRVFSQQRGGLLYGTQGGVAAVSGSTLTFNPTTDFRPGETVLATTTTAATGSSGLTLARGQVQQFTAGVNPASYGTFGGGSDVAAGTSPANTAAADVDGDGDLDLLIADNSSSGSVRVRLNNGSGSFSGTGSVAVGAYPANVVVADVDGDGDLDLLTANRSSSGSVSVRLNNGAGVFSGTQTVSVGSDPRKVAVGDLDGDGDLDFITANQSDFSMSVRLNDGAGTFGGGTEVSGGTTISPYDVLVADLDSDGDLDMLVTGTGNRIVWLNDGTGTSFTTTGMASSPFQVSTALGDVDGDGDLDAVVVDANNSQGAVLTNNGSGVLSPSSSFFAQYVPTSITLGDVDGDGDLDLVTNAPGNNGARTFLNDGSGTFSFGTAVALGAYPTSVALADVNGDGALDLLVTTAAGVSVRPNAPLPALTSLNPTSGPVGTSVTLTGTYFTGAAGVSFNGTAATAFTVVSATSITTTVPAGASTGDVTVTTPDGTSNGVAFTVVTQPDVVTLAAGSIGQNDASLSGVVTDDGGATVTERGVVYSTTNTLPTTVNTKVPMGSGTGYFVQTVTGLSANTTYYVRAYAINSQGTSYGAVEQFTTLALVPTLTSLSPTSGLAGTSVVLTGTNFTAGSTVSFNGTAASSVTFTSATSLTALVPAGAGTGPVTVTTANGTSNGVTFTVPLVVSSLSPARNALAAGRSANVGITFNQALNAATAGNVRVFSAQRGGQLVRGGNATASGSTLTVDPANDLRPGETVQVTVPASVTSTNGTAAARQVYQFTAGVSASSPGNFVAGTTTTIGTSTNPRDIAMGDIDGDGDLDMATANYGGNTSFIYTNNGSGTFTSSTSATVGSQPSNAAFADVDNDGDLDLLTANFAGNTVSVRLNSGSGAFSGSTDLSVGTGPYSVTAADVDGDGDLDLLTATSSTVSVLLNSGNGTSYTTGTSVALPTSAGFGLALGDVDNDGDLDLAATVPGSSLVYVRFNNGNGTFAGTASVSVGSTPYTVRLADVDNDGDLDLLTANNGSSSVSVRTNNGSGTFAGSTEVSVATNARGLAVADVDGDGDLDIVASSVGNTPGQVSISRNNGSGSFGPATLLNVGSNPYNVVAADVDGDGDLDLLAPNYSSSTVSVLLNKPPVPTLSSLSVTTGAAGTSVVLTGTNFTSGSTVSFGGTAATSVTFTSATSLTALVPSGATTGNVTVTTGGGTSNGIAFTVLFAVVSRSPARNALAASRSGGVGLTFSEAPSAATVGNVRVFSAQRGGQLVRGGNATASGSTLTVAPASSFRPGERVLVTVPASVSSGGGVAVARQGYQFTAGVSSTSPGTFLPSATTPSVAIGTRPLAVAAGDIDNDGDLDLVTANSDVATAGIRLNDGAGNYSGTGTVGVGNNPQAVVLGDVDGDGDLDLLTCSYTDNTVSVRFNSGSGAFSGTASVGVGNPRDLALADVDGDGDLDLLTANFGLNTVSVRLNGGSGTFGGGADYSAGNLPLGLAVGDMDGDGDVDLAVTNRDDNLLRVMTNNGSGAFAIAYTYTVGSSANGVTLGDVDGDGDLDVLNANTNSNTVSVGKNAGNGSLTLTSVSVGTSPVQVSLGDVDGDGDLDLIATDQGSGLASVRLNGGTGTFSGTQEVAVGATPAGLALADVDGDGDLDLLTAALNSSAVTVRLNKLPAPTLTSLNPTSGPVGTSVGLTGTGFTAASTVSFNGTAAVSVTFTSSTSLTATVPAGASTGNVTVSTPDGTSGGVSFAVTAPTVTGLNPTSGPVGTSVALTGTGFTSGSTVKFNGTTATAVTFNSTTSLTATVPTGATTGNVTVTTANGTSATGSGNLFAVSMAPTALALSPQSVAENAGANATVGTFSTTDPNSGDTFAYTLPAGFGDNAAFNISGSTLRLTAPADYETKNSYGIQVRTTDQSGLYFERTFTIGITNVNEAPGINAQSRSVAENSPNGTALGAALTATDPDAGTTLTYSITGGNAAGKFAISSSTGQLTVAGALDYETTNTYTLTVQVSDGSLSSSATVTVNVTDVNEAPGIAAQSRSIAENSANGTSVGIPVTATDPDAGTTLTYSITGGNTGGAFAINAGTGQITVAGALDFETLNTYSLTVQVSDGSLTAAATVTVNVTNVNEAPSISPATHSIAENAPNGTTVGAPLTATDPDAGTTLTYSITAGNTGGAFGIGSTGQLTVANVAALDYETTTTFALTVQVSDGTLTANATVTVNLTNVNEAPVMTNQTRSIAENSANGTNVGAPITATDPDAGTTLRYAITAGNGTGSGAFAISSSGQLTVADAAQLDFETTPVFTLTVRVSDGTLSTTATVTVNLTDVAEDLIVSGTANIPAGLYNNITVTGTGNATLTGAATVNGAVVVQSGGSLNTNCQALTGSGSFALAAGATLYVCDAAGLTPTGSTGAVQTATRSFNSDANYIYNGTAAQTTGAGLPAQVRNLSTTNASTVTLSAPVAVAQALTIGAAGNLALNGQALTLLSDATGTALVVNSGTGVVSGGTATVQRYLDPSLNPGLGYRHYTSPVSGNTLSDLATAGFAPVFNTAFNTSPTPAAVQPFPTVQGYDQARLASAVNNLSAFDKGFFSPTAATAFAPGTGYTVNIAASQKVDFVGTLNTGTYPVSLVRNSGATAAEAGWAMVGNPYPAPLDWTLVAPADRTGLDASMYVFESTSQYGGMYRAYTNGVGQNPLIASSQGFWVRVSSGQTAGTLTFRNAQRKTSFADQVPMRRGTADARPLVQLNLSGSGSTDKLFVYAEAGATAGLDRAYDAAKLPNTTGLNLAATAATGQALAIQGLPLLTAATTVPLTVGVPAAGAYTLTAAALNNLPAGTTATLVDNLTGTGTRLTPGTTYRFVMSGYTAPGRFFLNLTSAGALASAAATPEAQVQAYPNPTHGQLTIVRPAGTTTTAVLLNSLGQSVRTLALPTAETTVDLQGLASGVYTLRLTLDGQPVSKRVVVE